MGEHERDQRILEVGKQSFHCISAVYYFLSKAGGYERKGRKPKEEMLWQFASGRLPCRKRDVGKPGAYKKPPSDHPDKEKADEPKRCVQCLKRKWLEAH